ncbi:MAG: apolipoprotein N-acyltransferase [Deltaproteobacteria bacterium]|nr:apolipoprotein N-acyltransferase [Deltaproteobacteria bacterium]
MLARCGLAALSGALYFGGYTGFGQFYLTWVCFVPVLFAVRGLDARRTFAVGMVFGWTAQVGGFYWIAQLLEGFAGVPGPLAWVATVLLCAYQALVCALTLVLVRRAQDSLGLAPVWTLPVVFPALELAFPLVFPNAIGYSQYRFTAITQIVELSGLTLLGMLILAVNGGVYEVLDAARKRRPRLARLAVPALAFALALGWGLWRVPAIEHGLEDARRLRVALIQTNVGAEDKEALAAESLPRHAAASRAALERDPSIELIVWPETVYYEYISRRGGPVRGLVGRGVDVPLVFGAATAEFDGAGRIREFYNSMVLASAESEVLGIYDKIELVTLGETIPGLSTFPWLAQLLPVPALLDAGQSYRHLVLEDGTRMLPLVCIEDIIPSLPRRIWQVSGPPDVLVNVTNDSWYGETHEPVHHMAMSTFRTIETRRSLIRATNTGISVLVDPLGRITARTRVREATELIGDVVLVQDGRSTPYVRRGEVAGALAWALLALGGALDLRQRRRRRV